MRSFELRHLALLIPHNIVFLSFLNKRLVSRYLIELHISLCIDLVIDTPFVLCEIALKGQLLPLQNSSQLALHEPYQLTNSL